MQDMFHIGTFVEFMSIQMKYWNLFVFFSFNPCFPLHVAYSGGGG